MYKGMHSDCTNIIEKYAHCIRIQYSTYMCTYRRKRSVVRSDNNIIVENTVPTDFDRTDAALDD